jgi:hypothetical protein
MSSSLQFTTYLLIKLVWGLAVTMSVYCSGAAACAFWGGRMSNAIVARLKWIKTAAGLIAVQPLGSSRGALTGFSSTFISKRKVPASSHQHATGGIFATFAPRLHEHPRRLLKLDGVLRTALLPACIKAIKDRLSCPAGNRGP